MIDIKAHITDEYLQEIERKIKLYEEIDCKFKNEWADFEERYQKEIEHLDELREQRNAQLDTIKRSMRTYSETKEEAQATEVGSFKAIKKWSKFYNIDKLVDMLTQLELLEVARAEGIITSVIEVAKYDKVKAFLQRHGVDKEFEKCEDATEAGVAVFGPKPIPMLGAELPKE